MRRIVALLGSVVFGMQAITACSSCTDGTRGSSDTDTDTDADTDGDTDSDTDSDADTDADTDSDTDTDTDTDSDTDSDTDTDTDADTDADTDTDTDVDTDTGTDTDSDTDTGSDTDTDADGCWATGWQRVYPTITSADLFGVWGSGPDDVFAVGHNLFADEWGEILHWDGVAWNSMAPAADRSLTDVWGSGPNDVWVTAPSVSYSTVVMHFDGVAWTVGHEISGYAYLREIWGSGSEDVWVVGRDLYGSLLLHFDGTAWSESSDVVEDSLEAVGGSGPEDVWIVGADASSVSGVAIHRFDGTTWSEVDTSALPEMTATSIFVAGLDDAFVGGTQSGDGTGVVARWDGTGFTVTELGSNGVEVTGTGAGDVYALTAPSSEMWRWDGASWSLYSFAPSANLGLMYTDVWATGSGELLAVGYRGRIDRVSSGGWENLGGAVTVSPEDVCIAAPDSAFAVAMTVSEDSPSSLHQNLLNANPSTWSLVEEIAGAENMYAPNALTCGEGGDIWFAESNDAIWRRQGGSWSRHPLDFTHDIDAASLSDSGTLFALDKGLYSGRVVRFDGTGWADLPGTPAAAALVWAGADSAVFAANSLDLYHWDGSAWEVHAIPQGAPGETGSLTGLFGRSGTEVYLLLRAFASTGGYDSTVAIFDGSTISELPVIEGVGSFYRKMIWASGPDDVRVIGFNEAYDEVIARWDGAAWSIALDPSASYNAISGTGPDDVWIVGSIGSDAAIHWDGDAWSPVDTSAIGYAEFEDVFAAAPGVAYAADDEGRVWRYGGSAWVLELDVVVDLGLDLEPGESVAVHLDGNTAAGVMAWTEGGVVYRRGVTEWEMLSGDSGCGGVRGIWDDGAGEVWAVCREQTQSLGADVIHWNGTGFDVDHRETADLHAVWGFDADDVIVGGSGGLVSRFDGSVWNTSDLGTGTVHSLWGDAPADLYAAMSASIAHYDGAWSVDYYGSAGAEPGLYGAPTGEVVSYGEDGLALFDGAGWTGAGTAWSTYYDDTYGGPLALWGTSTEDLWAAFEDGSIWHTECE